MATAEYTAPERPYRRAMAWKVPLVTAGELHLGGSAEPIQVESKAWFTWLDDEYHRSFRFDAPLGSFTARRERKQRGQWYWVAYRQIERKLHKTYLGKSETLTEARLHAAAQALAAAR